MAFSTGETGAQSLNGGTALIDVARFSAIVAGVPADGVEAAAAGILERIAQADGRRTQGSPQ